jgi:uncharacterized paraquat-inducible protein A
MALVDCHECHKQVSDTARICPNCGAPVRATQQRILKWNLTVLAVGMVLMIIVAYGGCQMQKKVMHNFQIPPPPSSR